MKWTTETYERLSPSRKKIIDKSYNSYLKNREQLKMKGEILDRQMSKKAYYQVWNLNVDNIDPITGKKSKNLPRDIANSDRAFDASRDIRAEWKAAVKEQNIDMEDIKKYANRKEYLYKTKTGEEMVGKAYTKKQAAYLMMKFYGIEWFDEEEGVYY